MKLLEDHVEQAAITWLRELGWTYVHGPTLAPDGAAPERASYGDVILEGRLRAALARINPHLPPEALEDAARRILRPQSPSLAENNRAFHQWLIQGIQVQVRRQGQTRGDLVWLVDFERPENNDWLAVNQFTIVESKHNRRPDVLLFLNGMPIAVIELKNPRDEKATLDTAFRQLQTYKSQIPSLFVTNEILVISDGTEACVGSLTADRKRFGPWRVITGSELDDESGQAEAALAARPELEVLVRGLFDRERLLDYLRHFVLWETEDGYVKKIAGYHQFYAMRKTVAATVAAARGTDKRVGVVWHTQGSGKSISMVFYAGKIQVEPAMENPTLVILTDRNDLDGQLFRQFQAARDLLPAPTQAQSREHLRELLQVASGGIVFTTIQKFGATDEERRLGKRLDALSRRHNIVVMADEAHRTQYGFKARINQASGNVSYGLAQNLRDALPNAAFLAFTGTPIELDDKSTRLVFGPDIDRYTMRRAQQDGAVVPIHYEARVARIEMRDSERPRIDEAFEEVTEDADEAAREKMKSRWARLEAMVGTRKRLALVAEDIIAHFERRQEILAGKAMVVTMSRRIAADLYRAITRLRPEWHADEDEAGALKVVITGAATDEAALRPHVRSKARLREIEKRFKNEDDPLQMVIVCDMWLTGFDVPCLHTLYMDKPMQGHSLMQAIARVNRVYKDKPAGLVVDYLGVADALKRAVGVYSGRGDAMPASEVEQFLDVLAEKVEVARSLFHGFDHRGYFSAEPAARLAALTGAVNHVLEGRDDRKKRFLDAMGPMRRAAAVVLQVEEAQPYREDVAFFQAVEAAIRKHTVTGAGQSLDEMDAAIRQIVSSAVTSAGVLDVFGAAGMSKPDLSILSEDFLESMKASPYKSLQVELLNKLLRDDVQSMRRKNVVKARAFSEMLERIILAYQNRSIEAAQAILQLIDMAREMQADPARARELGLSEDEMAFYDALAEHGNVRDVMGDEVLAAIAQDLVAAIRSSVTIDWTQKDSVRAGMRSKIKRLLRRHGYPPDRRETAVETVLKQAEEVCRDWASEP